MADDTTRTTICPNGQTSTVCDGPTDAPYGGFLLQYGDNDAEPRWGGMTPNSPDLPDRSKPHPNQSKHAKSKYVLELVQDLILLGYLSPSRCNYSPLSWSGGKGHTGNFTIDVIPAVLALKYDLTQADGYGVNYTQKLDSVNPKPDTGTPGPIYWTTDWHFPRNAIIDVQQIIGNDNKPILRGKIEIQGNALQVLKRDTSLRNLEYTDTDGSKKREPFEDSESEYVRILQLLEELPNAEKTTKFDPKQVSKKLSDRKATLDKNFHLLGEQLRAKTDVLTNPKNGFVKTAHEYRDNFNKLKATLADPSKDILEWQTQQLDELYRKRNELTSPKTGEPFNYFNSLRDGLKKYVEDQLKKQVDKTLNDVSALLKKIQPVIDEGKASGSELAVLAATVTNFSKALTEFRDGVIALANDISGYDFKPAAERYAKMLRQYSMVDQATACCIKSMIHLRKINNRRAFVLPYDKQAILMTVDEYELGAERTVNNKGKSEEEKEAEEKKFKAAVDNLITSHVDRIQKYIDASKVFRVRVEMPPRMIQYAYKNESGFKQFQDRGELKRVALLGIDFANYGNPKPEWVNGNTLVCIDRPLACYDEVSNDPRRGYLVSRGWGFSQLTPPFIPDSVQAAYYVLKPDGTMEDHSTATEPAPKTRRGLPVMNRDEDFIPAYIASVDNNLLGGITVFAQKFAATPAKRNCTFTKKHDCDNCLSRFETGDFSFDQKLYYIISPAGYQTIRDDMVRASVPAESLPLEPTPRPDTSDTNVISKWREDEKKKRAEWPCSWLSARLAYGGVSEQSFKYVPQSVSFARVYTGKDTPPTKKKTK